MVIPSVFFSFLEAALKRWPRATRAEIKKVMSTKLKTYMAVHGGSQMMVKKDIYWEIKVQLCIHSNAIGGLQIWLFFRF